MFYFLLLYPLMGIIHVIGALLRLCFGNKIYTTYKSKLAKYLLIVGIYFLIMILFTNVEYLNGHITNDLGTVYIAIIPWFIAVYYWTIIYGITKTNTTKETHSLITNN